MSNDVQSHDTVVERAATERRTSGRHAAAKLGAVQARLIGGSPVDLVNFSNRGVLFECDSRLLVGARASVRIASPEHNLVVTGRVVRSRVKGLVNGALRYDAALALDHEFALTPALVELMARAGAVSDEGLDTAPDPEPVAEYLAESEASLAEALRERGAAPASDEPPALVDQPPPLAEPATADDEAVAFEADGDIAFEPAIEFTIEPAVEFAFEGGDQVEPAATPFFDATPQASANPGVSMFDATPAGAGAGADPYEQVPTADGDVAFEAAAAFAADDAVDFETAAEVPPVEDAPPAVPLAAAEAVPERPSDALPAPPDVEDRVLQQFAATVPQDLADLRRLAADNQW